MVYVLLDETEEEREFFSHDGCIAQDIYDLIGYGQEDHTAGNGMYFWMTSEALALFQEGGELYEKYQEYCFPERMVLQQMIGGEIAAPEQRDFETRQRFYWLLSDPSAAYIIKGLVLRSLCNTGLAMLCVVFSFLGKSEWKAIALSSFFMLAFIIRRSNININPYRFIADAFWESCHNVFSILQIGVVTAFIFVIAGVLSAELFCRTELK